VNLSLVRGITVSHFCCSFFLFFSFLYALLCVCECVPDLSFLASYLFKEKKKLGEKKKRKKKKGLTAVPSLRERSASCPRSAGWACTLGITGGEPVAQSHLSASVRITGYRAFWLQAQEVENRMCTEWPRLVLDYWGGKCSEPQSASEHATSTSRQSRVQFDI